MTDDTNTIEPERRLIFRAGIGALAAVQLIDGLYALLAPRSFYDDFPFGRAWVSALPDYSEHLVRDVGGLFLGTAILLGAAAWFLERRLVAVALVSFLAFSIPHATYHFLNLEPYATGDVIANVIGLGATVVIPIALLFLMRRPGAVSSPATARDPGPSSRGRVELVGDGSRNPLVLYAFHESRKHGGGEVMDPVRVFAHHPGIMLGYGMHEMATERADRVPERLKHLAVLRAAMLAGCEWCLDYGSAVSTSKNVSEADLRAIPVYAENDHFDGTEKLVLDYATGMSRTPAEIPDELFAALRERFDEAQLVELTDLIALENYRARFNWAFGLAGQGYSDGAYCVMPEVSSKAGQPAASA